MSIPRLSVFPKCYFDLLCRGEMDYRQWIRSAATLGAEGIEHYDGFFRSFEPADVDPIVKTMAETGQVSSMLCFSPDFTADDEGERARQIERQRRAIDLALALGTRYCRTLSGQNRPGLTRAEGIARTVDGLLRSIEYAARRGVVLCLENHYKDGNWFYPEFAQPEDIFLEILERVDSPHLGVQYDPSNALVGGSDPIAFLRRVLPRLVTVHASDRYVAGGATLDDPPPLRLRRGLAEAPRAKAELREADGTIGYSDKLTHGETGRGLIDYDAIFGILSDARFDGWISVEDGMNGLDELRRSVAFLAGKRQEYFATRVAE